LTRAIILVLLVLILVGMGLSAASLTILYTNDIHSRVSSLEGLAQLIEEEQAEDGSFLLFDAGDAWQDFRVPLYAVWGDEYVLDWMNRVGYAAMAIGNHEFYLGTGRLAELAARAEFPILCANLRPAAGYSPPFIPYTILSCAGIKILVIGLVTGEFLPYSEFPWLRYIEPERALQEILKEAAEPADLIVVLGHLGIADAKNIVKTIPGIDIFFTGHSHEVTKEPVRVGGTLILQAGAFGRRLGRLSIELEPETGSIKRATNELLPVKKNPVLLAQGWLRLIEVTLLTVGLLALMF
jgi:2',3'-cyclic-nucleotide 2'-phosphodiesterase (5'-nucleotidase family)